MIEIPEQFVRGMLAYRPYNGFVAGDRYPGDPLLQQACLLHGVDSDHLAFCNMKNAATGMWVCLLWRLTEVERERLTTWLAPLLQIRFTCPGCDGYKLGLVGPMVVCYSLSGRRFVRETLGRWDSFDCVFPSWCPCRKVAPEYTESAKSVMKPEGGSGGRD